MEVSTQLLEVAFWLCVLPVVWLYVGYGLVVRLLARLWGTPPPRDPGCEPTVTIVVPAHNEQVAKILSDPEASQNDRGVAMAFLRNAEIAANFEITVS